MSEKKPAFFYMDDHGESMSLKVNGSASELISMFANAFVEHPELIVIAKIAIASYEAQEEAVATKN